MTSYIYGAGCFGEIISMELRKSGTEFLFLDLYSKKDSLLGVPILSPKDITVHPEDVVYNSVAVAPLTDHSQKDFLSQIAALGFEKIYEFEDICKLFPNALKALSSDGFLWRTLGNSSSLFLDDRKCQQVKALLSDERSCKLLDTIVAFRKEPNLQAYLWPDFGQQYIEIDFEGFPSQKEMHVVDLGAWTGDTLFDFSNAYGDRLKTIHCFEPNPLTFKKLEQKSEEIGIEHSDLEIFLHCYATGKENKTVYFDDTIGSSSHISTNEGVEVSCVTLDNYLKDTRINYLKLDVEGAEYDTIIGAEKIITENQHVENRLLATNW